MIIPGIAGVRRAMRRHQAIPPRRPRLPLWRLVLGEVWWAIQQLWHEPRVLVALLVGGPVTVAVLGATAPGPVLPWPGRIVTALVAGLALARGTWAWIKRRRSRTGSSQRDAAPGVAATEVVAGLVALVLVGWLVVWLVNLVV